MHDTTTPGLHPGPDDPTATPSEAGTGLAPRLAAIGAKQGFGANAVESMWEAILRGQGGMAQFAHREFGGSGQWLRGGMIMVGDMFNHSLAARVDALCDALSQLYETHPEWTVEAPRRAPVHWWPEGLDRPSSSGAQNGVRYAWFPQQRRLAVEREGEVQLYDTAEHRIGGVAQQQQGDTAGLSFTSQLGTVALTRLQQVGATDDARTTG